MKKIKSAAVYDPYLETLGGGERYLLQLLKVFDKAGIKIDLIWDEPSVIASIKNRFDLEFDNLDVKPNFLNNSNFDKLQKLASYDWLFYISDGSYFFSTAHKNYIYAMVPERKLYKKTVLNSLKWQNCQFITHSQFVKKIIDQWTGKESIVIYPYIDEIFFKPEGRLKKRQILSVGRFFSHLHSKRQDIIIKAFKKLKQQNNQFKDFRLILAGGLREEDENYLETLKKLAGNDKNISFVVNPNQKQLLELYYDSLFYWHGAGFGIDEKTHPELVEHLGLTPLEAMAAGAVVFVHNSGGPKEYIKNDINGFTYDSIEELIDKTSQAYLSKTLVEKIAKSGANLIKTQFTYEKFRDNIVNRFGLIS